MIALLRNRLPRSSRRVSTGRRAAIPAGLRDPGVLAALLVPACGLVLAMKLASGPAPVAASSFDPGMMMADPLAMEASPGDEAGSAAIAEPTPAAAAAWARAGERAEVRFGRSPLISADPVQVSTATTRPGSAPIAGAAPIGPPLPKPQPAKVVQPRIDLTTLMETRTGPVAVIDGRLLRVGDEVAAGWVVRQIEVRLRRIEVRHESGRVGRVRL